MGWQEMVESQNLRMAARSSWFAQETTEEIGQLCRSISQWLRLASNLKWVQAGSATNLYVHQTRVQALLDPAGRLVEDDPGRTRYKSTPLNSFQALRWHFLHRFKSRMKAILARGGSGQVVVCSGMLQCIAAQQTKHMVMLKARVHGRRSRSLRRGLLRKAVLAAIVREIQTRQ